MLSECTGCNQHVAPSATRIVVNAEGNSLDKISARICQPLRLSIIIVIIIATTVFVIINVTAAVFIVINIIIIIIIVIIRVISVFYLYINELLEKNKFCKIK